MGDIKALFPGFYYHGEVPSHQYLKRLFLKELDDAQLNSPSEWNCSLSSSFDSNTNLTDFSWDVFEKAIQDSLMDMHMKLGGDVNHKIRMIESWINVYNKGDMQDVHTHAGGDDCTFSCAYFLDYIPEEDANFIFYHPDQKVHIGNFSKYYPVNTTWFPEVNEGDIIIFPAYQHHQVSMHKSDHKRITISANFIVRGDDYTPTQNELVREIA